MNKLTICLLLGALSVAARAQDSDATMPAPPSPPALDATRMDWQAYLLSYNSWLHTNGLLSPNTNDSYMIHGDWSVTTTNTSSGLGMLVMAGSSPALELENSVWLNSGGPHPSQSSASAYAHERWNTSANQAHTTGGYYEYEFRYWGGPWHTGLVSDIEAWYEFVGVARAYNSDCGAYAASAGKYSDGVGADLVWSNAVAAEAGTNVLPVSVGLQPPGGGPTVSITLGTSSNGCAVKFDSRHRPKASKRVKGTPQNPGIVTVMKEITLETSARLYSFVGWAGPAQAEALHACFFHGLFTEL